VSPARKQTEPKIRVGVEVDAAIPGLAEAAEWAIQKLLPDELAELLERLGLRGRLELYVEPVESTRALGVRVRGVLQPYDPRLTRQVWLAVVDDESKEAALRFDPTPGEGVRDRWLRTAIDDRVDTSSVARFVSRLVVAVVERRAAWLVDLPQVADYASTSVATVRSSSWGTPLGDVMRSLLGLGVSVESRKAVLGMVQDGPARQTPDLAETLIARLRPNRIEIQTHPATLTTLLPDKTSRSQSIVVYAGAVPEPVRAEFQDTEKAVYLEFGLRLPDLFWAPSVQIAAETVAVKINDMIGVGLPLPPPGRLMVNAAPSQLEDVEALPALGPAGPSALIRAEDAEAVQRLGYTTFDRLAFVQYLVFAEVRRNAARLLSVRDVEFELHRMREPDLARAVLERWSLGEITRVLRQLLDGGLSIRDMSTVLDRLLSFDTIDADADRVTVFDDRLPVDGPLPETPRARARMLARFVREGMAAFIGSRFAFGSDTMVVYLLDPEFEELAVAVAPDDLEEDVDRAGVEAALVRLRNSVWEELSYLPLAAATPVVLTSRRARTAVRRVLAPELPDLRVVRHSEVPHNLNLMPVARIPLLPETVVPPAAAAPAQPSGSQPSP
jgi:hypothetical protein